MQTPATLFLDGLTTDELDQLENSLERRRFSDGNTILAEGDAPSELYIILSGLATVSKVDSSQVEHRISTVGRGDSIGEMSLLTGQSVSATVRAVGDVEVLVLPAGDFDQIFARFPQLYRNVGSILSTRLMHTNRRAVRQHQGHITLLVDHGAPELLGWAVASSVAWHSRRPTVLVSHDNGEPDPTLRTLAAARTPTGEQLPFGAQKGRGTDRGAYGAVLMLVTKEEEFSQQRFHRMIETLRDQYAYVLVQTRDLELAAHLEAKKITLLGPDGRFEAAQESGSDYALQGWSTSSRHGRPGSDGTIPVSAPSATEIEALSRGVLPISEAAGQSIGWVARDISSCKIGLALGAGAVKGYAHIGVLQVLERLNVPVDYIAGTSIGAAVASAYAVGFPLSACERVMDQVGKHAFKIAVPRYGILSNSGIQQGLRRVVRDRRIEDLHIPLAIVAADIETGREVVFRRGLLWPAILASMAIPGVYPAVPIGDHILVDGGAVNPVPSDAASTMGADIVIAVKLARRANDDPIDAESLEPTGRAPVVLQTITRAIDIMQGKIATESAAAATITVEPTFPDFSGWGLRTFGEGKHFVDVGRAAAEEAVPRLVAALPWLRDTPVE